LQILLVQIGFAFSFHLLLPDSSAFHDPFTSGLKVLVMMSGEFEFENNFVFESGVDGMAQEFGFEHQRC
jgi:hypothetical protein